MTLKELKYVLYGDDRLSTKLRSVAGASDKANRSLNKTSTRMGKFRGHLKDASNDIPFFNQGMRMMQNPLIMAAGGIGLVGTGLFKALNHAKAFRAEFREIVNLNINKADKELSKLKSRILDLSQQEGFNPLATSTGFYDIQSVTGLYGDAVDEIVRKQGRFSKLMRADFNSWIAGTGKAMANYGFGASELDRFNQSAYKLVNVGVITFDQLAKVMPVFAGAAAAANQDFDSANKLMALFTARTKSAEEAATLTKSAFIDLFKPSSIKAFKAVGIDLFDSVTGKAKQVDQILRELNAKFQSRNSERAVADLRNQFTGSEGLIALIQAASDKSGSMLNTLNNFDKAGANMERVMQKAREDVDYLNSEINDKLAATWTKLGEKILPTWIKIKEVLNSLVDGIGLMFDQFNRLTGAGSGADDPLKAAQAKGAAVVDSKYMKLVEDAKAQTKAEYTSNMLKLQAAYESVKQLRQGEKDKWTDSYMKGQEKALNSLIKKYQEARFAAGALTGKTQQGGEESGTREETPDPYVASGLNTVAGGGNQIRNINVSFGSVMEIKELNNVFDKSGNIRDDEVFNKIVDGLVRAVRGAEQTLSYS